MNKELSTIPINKIRMNNNQPRTKFDEEKIEELANSIKENGLLQPIIVKKTEDDQYELIAGERRLRAHEKIGALRITAIITNYTNVQSAVLSLIENIQRENLSAIEEANAYLNLMNIQNITRKELAKQVGKTQSTIANKIRLLNLNQKVKEIILDKKITERHGRELLKLPISEQPKIANKIIKEKLTVSQTEKIIDQIIIKKNSEKKENINKQEKYITNKNLKININTMMQSVNSAKKLVEFTGTKVNIEEKDEEKSYKIIISIEK